MFNLFTDGAPMGPPALMVGGYTQYTAHREARKPFTSNLKCIHLLLHWKTYPMGALE
jgi:hypothetical protein